MPTKKTILVLASTYPRWSGDHEPGFIHELSKRLTSEFNVIALVPDAVDSDVDGVLDGVEVIRYRYAPKGLQSLVNNGGIVNNLKTYRWKWLLIPGFILGQYLAIRKILKEHKIDVIHAHWLIPQGWIACILAQAYKIPFVVTSHGGDLFGLQGNTLTKVKKIVAEQATAMTVVSQAMEEYLAQVSIKPKILQVIPMGVDLKNRFTPNLKVRRNTHELLFVGRLVPKKGLNYLLLALPHLLKEHPNLNLNIAGFGPEELILKQQVKALGLKNHVKFLGALAQEQLPELYQKATLFVAPFVRADNGDQEGLPVALMEAIGTGCPAIVGHVAGIEDLLGAEIQQIAVNPSNTQELVNAISEALKYPAIAQARAIHIRKNAIDLIDWESISKKYANILHMSIACFSQNK
ncbi:MULTISPECIES: glycosyltransferase [Acinetobacter]|jgi:glycosyltransferase involved in cell wall biosynthesis|uniref:Glycosyltransferase family 4 protein n=2 Tax=Acinetobacter TaxID=469 RepID=A0A4Q7B0G7_9GAMM|nr:MULTISPECIES: glycosyltransferase [Acinetobacter]MCW8038278.1 glycosyltransferase [Acinetobacter entericus]RZG69299.1 glycosyltransferase family 4 protein [Acinetobacter bouvetii]TCB75320.1 glycosyltransferase family 4 protein [Acinetobacter sp. ANC 4177]